MFKKIFLIIFLSAVLGFFTTTVQASDEINILFVGNSLTFANDLPGMLAKMADADGRKINYQTSAPGGWRLARHARDKNLDRLFRDRDWDYVVLQEQSQLPAFDERRLKIDVYPYAKQIVKKIRAANRSTEILFYMTMAHRDGDRNAQNRKAYPHVSSYVGMQKQISSTYVKMARQNRGTVVPVGAAWMEVRDQKPQMNMYNDSVHPNVVGTYLAACVFYSSLFNQAPPSNIHPQQVQPSQAKFLQQIAHQTVQRF